jgi:hypothetical protein
MPLWRDLLGLPKKGERTEVEEKMGLGVRERKTRTAAR